MPIKTKVLTLSYPHTGRDHSRYYRVEKAIDTVEFSPRELLEPEKVSELCEAPHWKVNITPHQEGS